MWLLYIYSDILGFLLYHVVKYRRKVVFDNLKNSFPEKTDKELSVIAKKYYRHLSDLFFEAIKGFTMSKKNIRKRYNLIDAELTKKYYENNQNIIFAAGHYGNWEWGTRAIPYQLYHKSVVLYKPIKDKKINNYFKKLRSKDNVAMYSIFQTPRAFYQHNEPFAVVMLSDQSPSNLQKAIWVDFLNRPTATLHGIELYAKRYNTVVIFTDFDKVKRGYYQANFEVITENPKDLPDGEITKKYMNLLENKIKNKPEIWLWSHKRWKAKFDANKYSLTK